MTQTSSAYISEQFHEAYPNGVENHYWNLGRNLIIHSLLKKTLQKNKVLEIGAGRGIVVQFLYATGVNIWGCDLSGAEMISSQVKDRLFLQKDAFQLPEEFRNEVNTLLLLDVLEHLETPKNFLMECENKFPQLKNILITVPARQELWSNFDEKYGHYKRYDLNSLIELAPKSNWKVKQHGYFFHLLYPIARVLLAVSNKRATTIKAPLTPIQILLHKIMGYCFYFEVLTLPKSLPGTSAFILLEKN